MLNGLVLPDTGRIEMRGRVGALIALGAGFNPILSGRENIYVNGAVLGLSKREIDEKFDEIVDFAELGDFIDAPVQSYSSGMAVRLGFAVATALEPDILILDEVLAVGDIGFVIKCLNRVKELCSNSAVILVSHQMQHISTFCSRVMLLARGRVAVSTKSLGEAFDAYYSIVAAEKKQSGTGHAELLGATLMEGDRIDQGTEATLSLQFEIHRSVRHATLHLYVTDIAMVPIIYLPVMSDTSGLMTFGPGSHDLLVPLGPVDLVAGNYSLTVGFVDTETETSILRTQGVSEFRVVADRMDWGRVLRPVIPRQ
jgi:lipopolysaccharide transport system ATP-binding protein